LSLGWIFLVQFPWNSGLVPACVEDIRHLDLSSAKARFIRPAPRTSAPSVNDIGKEKKSAPVTSHQAPSPGFLNSTPPLPCPQWLPPSWPRDLPAFPILGPGGAMVFVLYDHTVSLDQAFRMDRFSLLNRQRKAADLCLSDLCLPVHRLRYWPWPFPRPTPALHRPLPGPSRACLDIKMTTLSTALEL
jgi:hypothetical protein